MAEPSKELVSVVENSALPALLLRVPSEEIIAASEQAGRLLGVPVKKLVGRSAEDFAVDAPSGGLALIAQGRVSGFQATRTLVGGADGKQRLQVWVRGDLSNVPVGYAMVVLWPGGRAPWMYLPDRGEKSLETHEIVGTVDAHLLVDRVSDDVRRLCTTPEQVIGSSFFQLFDITSAAEVLHAVATATSTGRGLCLAVNICRDDEPAMGELMLRPLVPAPSFSFVLAVRDAETLPKLAVVPDQNTFESLGRGLHALALADTLAQFDAAGVKGAEKLTTREMDIVMRLMDGDRVPAIARDMYLSQSTIRNHLSSVFRKLGVSSQQQLIDLIRDAAKRLGSQDISSS